MLIVVPQFIESQGEYYDNTDQNSGSMSDIADIESISDNFDDEDDSAKDGLGNTSTFSETVAPFAPSEMYLSDLVDAGADDALGFCIGVDEDLVYRPHGCDPLSAINVPNELKSSINSMRTLSSGKSLPTVVYGLDCDCLLLLICLFPRRLSPVGSLQVSTGAGPVEGAYVRVKIQCRGRVECASISVAPF